MPAQQPLAQVIREALKAERNRRSWSQEHLAELVPGWSQSMVSDTELGRRRPDVEDLPKLCRAFGIPLRRFLVDADPADLEALGL